MFDVKIVTRNEEEKVIEIKSYEEVEEATKHFELLKKEFVNHSPEDVYRDFEDIEYKYKDVKVVASTDGEDTTEFTIG